MSVLLRVLLTALIIFAVIAAGAYLSREALLGFAARQALARVGFENPQLRIEELTLQRVSLRELRAGPKEAAPALSVEAIDVTFSWRRLLQERRVDAISVGPARIIVNAPNSGPIRIAGLSITEEGRADGNRGSPLALPFEQARLRDVMIKMNSDGGAAELHVNADLNSEAGGKITASLAADQFRLGDLDFGTVDGAATVDLAEDGAFAIRASGAGAAAMTLNDRQTDIRAIDASFSATGASWRDLASNGVAGATGKASVVASLNGIGLDADTFAEFFSYAGESADIGAPLETADANLSFDIEFDGGAVTVSSKSEHAMSIASNRGDIIAIASRTAGKPLLIASKDGLVGQAQIKFDGPAFAGTSAVNFNKRTNEPLRFALGATSDRMQFSKDDYRARFSSLSLIASGQFGAEMLRSNLWVATNADEIRIGRMSLTEMPFNTQLSLEVDLNSNSIVVRQPTRDAGFAFIRPGCLAIDAGAMTIESEDLRAKVREANFCAREGAPLLTATFGPSPTVEVVGSLFAERAEYALGETSLKGAPPRFDIDLSYDPTTHRTVANSAFSGGNVIINGALRGSDATGNIRAELLQQSLKASFTANDVKFSQVAEIPQLATLRARAAGKLEDDVIIAQYSVQSPTGAALGGGEFRHEVKTGVGQASYLSRRLEFSPDSLEPASVVLALTGIISEATGAAEVASNIQWTKEALNSNATIALDNVSFRGPGVAVSQTRNVAGDIALQNLLPVKSKGAQTIKIGAMEIGALILENGVVEFSMPGDDTLEVIKAEFPWYGGRIGAYDSAAGFTGETARTLLRAEDVDLAAMLASLEIDGLSGEGRVEGSLPLIIENGRARIEDGRMVAVGPGVIRYTGDATSAAATVNEQTKVAFGVLSNLKFETLTAEIDGPLDGALQFRLLFEGTNEIPLTDARLDDRVVAPVIYRINLEAPLLSIINNARNTSDPGFLLNRARDIQVEGEKIEVN